MRRNIVSELQEGTTPILSVGAVSANLMALGRDIDALEQYGIRVLHFDCMDGHFAPPLTAGPFFVKGIKTSMLKDVHLMIENPLDKIADYVAAGADMISVHIESSRHIHRALQIIGEARNVNDPDRAIVRGLALNPDTPVAQIEPLLDETDMIVLVAINPGFSSQKFIAATKEKFRQLQNMLLARKMKKLICIDGGITKDTIADVAALHPHLIVSGSAVFENSAIASNLDILTRSFGARPEHFPEMIAPGNI